MRVGGGEGQKRTRERGRGANLVPQRQGFKDEHWSFYCQTRPCPRDGNGPKPDGQHSEGAA